MDDTDDDVSPYKAGYITPPLSPTKTVSTEGWLSPRTPAASPRKTRSCLFVRHLDHADDGQCFTPPESPSKSNLISRFSALSIPELPPATCDPTPPQSDNASPEKHNAHIQLDNFFLFRRTTFPRLHSRSAPDTGICQDGDLRHASVTTPITDPTDISTSSTKRRYNNRSLSENAIGASTGTCSPTVTLRDTIITQDGSPVALSTHNTTFNEKTASLPKFGRLPLRHASSPLRPSQWAMRGGLLSLPNRSQTNTPDRFISSRRPPAITRESFELNKPAQRLQVEQMTCRGAPVSADAFSRRLRRSNRMNEELRGLRDAHSIISGRTISNRRNINFVRSPLFLSGRQVSAGAVWNVGGPSAVSDTVEGVSTGTGGMLGSGTNAPLYRSAFLNRADPEAEMEAYEKRLALALDIDQTDRVLKHSPSPLDIVSHRCSGAVSQAKHVWRDGVWTKDGIIARLSSAIVPWSARMDANTDVKYLAAHNRTSEDPYQFYPSDMFLRECLFMYTNPVYSS